MEQSFLGNKTYISYTAMLIQEHIYRGGEVIELDTWVGASGKNGMRRDWLLQSHSSGIVYARATSTWVMMNQKTRRLSKIPDEVRDEISPWYIEKHAIKEDKSEKIEKLNDNAKYAISDLKPKRSDLDMNHHVNNVKYVRWMFETIPDEFLEKHQLSSMVLEYRRECGSADIVQSLCEPFESGILYDGATRDENTTALNGFSMGSTIFSGSNIMGCFDREKLKFTHLLKVQGEKKYEEIVRGRTTWKRNNPGMPFSA